jgi:glutamine cyclotransferase
MKTEKKANRYHSDMENDRVQTNRRIAPTMFNDGVIRMGRVLVLFAFTSQMGQQYPTDAWKFWDIYHTVLKGTEYEYMYFNRSLIHQSE